MPRRSITFICLTAFVTLLVWTTARAAMPVANAVPDSPATVADRSSPVNVEHEGTDTIGAKLAFDLKELFNSSSLFTLSEKDEPKLQVLISTAPEFPGRLWVRLTP